MFSSPDNTFRLALVFGAIATAFAGPLSLTVTAPVSISGVENLRVTTTLTNTGERTLKVLNDPQSILSDLPTDIFAFTNSAGENPAFVGVRAKYSPQRAATVQDPAGITILEPGQSVSVEHDISKAYNFTMSGAGTYEMEATNRFLVVTESGEIETIYADGGSRSVQVSGNLGVNVIRNVGGRALAKRIGYSGCTADRQTLIAAAVVAAEVYAAESFAYLSSAQFNTSSPRYAEWFGAYDATRKATVTQHYQLLNGNDFSTFTFDCTCTRADTYAYVYANSFGTIYLCPVFWNIGVIGTDSRGGTIIHESSHFTVNGGTSDVVYGQTRARTLARSDPASAIRNADSHEYFAENNPFLL